MKSILFKPEMHRAIRDLRKTVTRRPLPEIINAEPDEWMIVGTDGICYGFEKIAPDPEEHHINLKPKYQPGEIVYIKEAWYESEYFLNPDNLGEPEIYYKLTQPDMQFPKGKTWKSPLFLPEKYARDFIEIISFRPERLQEITYEDAIREGVPESADTSRYYFHVLWDSINKKHPWESNPWIWRYEFRLVD